MWVQIFLQRIKKEKIENKKAVEIMGVSEAAFYAGIKNDSFKFQNILKVYKLFDWDLNELKSDDINIVNEPDSLHNRTKSTIENYSQQIENIKRIYESHIDTLKEQNETLKKQLDFLKEIIKKEAR
jgi:vacuolar-type H+-ATPase subunit I/STV1